MPGTCISDMQWCGHCTTCMMRHFGNHTWLTASVLLQQASGGEEAEDGQVAAGGRIQAYWQDDGEEEDLHMEDSM